MTRQPATAVVVGAYPAVPKHLDADGLRAFVQPVLDVAGIDGFEIPFADVPTPWTDPAWLHGTAPAHRHVITMIPSVMIGMQSAPAFGLASDDDGARKAALEAVRQAHAFTSSVHDDGGSIVAIELHSAPRPPLSSRASFERSLDEIAGWDWGDTRILVEHCDVRVAGHEPAKGFLSIEEEIGAVAARGMGVLVNWGRSVIETRRAEGARDHIAAVARAGVLGGVVFSGVSPDETQFGPAWVDAHLPIREWSSSPAAHPVATSLLTREAIALAIDAAGMLPPVVGLKVGAPSDATTEDRIDMLTKNAAILRQLVDLAGPAPS